jgi:hypothetical protein
VNLSADLPARVLVGVTPEGGARVREANLQVECREHYLAQRRDPKRIESTSSRMYFVPCDPLDESPDGEALDQEETFPFAVEIPPRKPLSFQSEPGDPEWGIVWELTAKFEMEGAPDCHASRKFIVRPEVDASDKDNVAW